MPAAKSPREPNEWSRCVDFLKYIREQTAMFPNIRNPADDRYVDDHSADLLVSKESDITRNVDVG
jgi:hypothetical protein